MNASPSDNDTPNTRADFWRGFLYGTANALALTAIGFIVSFVLRN